LTWKLILPGVAVVAVVALGLGFFWPFGSERERLKLPGVVEIQEVRLASKIGGRIQSIEVNEGDVVEPDRLIVRLEVPELEAQRDQAYARVKAAEAELAKAIHGARPEEKDAARAQVAAAEASHARLIAGWREEEVRQAKGELEMADANLKLAREAFDREDKLFRSGSSSSSRADWDTARYTRDSAQGRYAAAKARHEMLDRGSRTEDIAEAAAKLDQAKANQRLIEAGTREEDKDLARARLAEAKAKLNELEANLKEAEVRAPERALIDVLAVRKGDVVAPNQPVARVLRAADMWVKVYVPETLLGKINVGQPVTLTVDSEPGKKFSGSVTHIAAESEFTPRNVQSVDERRHQVFGVKIKVDDPQGVFKAGMAAEATFDF
jgi:multidrug resistance efflux pump